MDAISVMALAAGLSWASGIRLYAVLFISGAFHALGLVDLPDSLQVLAHPAVLCTSGTLLALEFVADKIPGLDSIWDAIHTFVRIPAGALLAVGAVGSQGTAAALVAALLGGVLAGSSHLTKSGGRMLINASPEPVSNWVASFGEDALVPAILVVAFKFPLLLLTLVVLFVIASLWLLPKLVRALAVAFARLAAIIGTRGRG